MKLELIVPATQENLLNRKKAPCPPLGLSMVAALTPPGVEVSLTDENVTVIDFQKDTDLVGITVLTITAKRAYKIADTFRVLGVKVILEGSYPSALPKEANDNGEVFIAADSSGSPSIYVGGQAADLQTRGFLSFDVSDIVGKNVTDAWLTIRGSRVGDPTTLMRELGINSTNYGDSLGASDYEVSWNNLNNFPSLANTDFSFINEALRNAVQETLNAERQYFQLILVIN